MAKFIHYFKENMTCSCRTWSLEDKVKFYFK